MHYWLFGPMALFSLGCKRDKGSMAGSLQGPRFVLLLQSCEVDSRGCRFFIFECLCTSDSMEPHESRTRN